MSRTNHITNNRFVPRLAYSFPVRYFFCSFLVFNSVSVVPFKGMFLYPLLVFDLFFDFNVSCNMVNIAVCKMLRSVDFSCGFSLCGTQRLETKILTQKRQLGNKPSTKCRWGLLVVVIFHNCGSNLHKALPYLAEWPYKASSLNDLYKDLYRCQDHGTLTLT